MKQEIVLIWITFLPSAYPDKILSYKAAEIYMELKGRAVWCKAQLYSYCSCSLWTFHPLNLVRFLILKRSRLAAVRMEIRLMVLSQNYNVSVKGSILGGLYFVVLNENYKRIEVRKFDKKCRLLIFNDLVFRFCC